MCFVNLKNVMKTFDIQLCQTKQRMFLNRKLWDLPYLGNCQRGLI